MRSDHEARMEGHHYRLLAVMVVLHFAAMYGLMYSMANSTADVYHNINQVYMAGLMTTSMVAIEVALMRSMYTNRRLNLMLIGGSLLVLGGCFTFIRKQTAVGDRQFLRSMIPHHSAAILMCQQATLRDPEIERLCSGIVSSQQAEIDQMRELLSRDGE